mmetsp:Transcript_32744/g.42072  ORF Transcript_32744/g.42072 Transcript_32744/m.42072 type:complete len:84 (-) Transcript_32744:221-472(-)
MKRYISPATFVCIYQLFICIPYSITPFPTFSPLPKLAAEEMALLDSETRTRRRARLREFYQQQEVMQSRELESKGLAFARERL